MKVGDLVRHKPWTSTIEIILHNLGGDDAQIDFCLGVIVDQKGKMSRVFSHDLKSVRWYASTELQKLD